uniref:Uncharacterized protein n=1 Tax=Vibrio vulnificus TaxID=672 RepID=A0A6S4Q749_VIBVL|nr:conserved hypothetical protein [Vibrio vulnificus]
MFNHQKSVDYGFSLFPRLIGFTFVSKLAFVSAFSGHLFFGAGNSGSCLIQFSSKREVRAVGAISILSTGFGA